MKVILLIDIAGVGRKGDIKDVAEGYAQNFLLPRKMAIAATSAAIERLKIENLKGEESKKIQYERLEENLGKLKDKQIILKSKANKSGHLFAGIHKGDIAQAIVSQTQINIPEENIELDENIKSIGTYKIPLIFDNKKSELELIIEGE